MWRKVAPFVIGAVSGIGTLALSAAYRADSPIFMTPKEALELRKLEANASSWANLADRFPDYYNGRFGTLHRQEYNKALTHVVAKLGRGSCAGADELLVRGLTRDTQDKPEFVRDLVNVAHCNEVTKAFLAELLQKMADEMTDTDPDANHTVAATVAAICSYDIDLLHCGTKRGYKLIEDVLRNIVL